MKLAPDPTRADVLVRTSSVLGAMLTILLISSCSALRMREERDALAWGALDLELEIDGVEEGSDVAIWMPIPVDTETQRVVNPSFDPPKDFEFEPVVLDRNELLFVEGIALDDEVELSVRVEIEFTSEPAAAGIDEAYGWRIDPSRRRQSLGPATQIRIRNANAADDESEIVHSITWTQGDSIELRPQADGGPLMPPAFPAIEIDGVRLAPDDERVRFRAEWSEF